MGFIRWILSHIILFSFVGIVVYAVINWDELSGKGTPLRQMITMAEHELDKFMGDGKPKLTRGEKYRLRLAREAKQAKAAASASSVSTNEVDAAVPGASSDSKTDMAENKAPANELWVGKAMDTVRDKTMAVIGVKDDVKAPASTSDDRSLWIQARTSCQKRDFSQCESLYQQLVSNDGGNYDAYGELGNVYFVQKKFKDAANAWFNTARILIDKGQAMRARSVMPLLQRLDAEKAGDLQKILDEKLSAL